MATSDDMDVGDPSVASDDDDAPPPSMAANTWTNKRRAQKAIFDSWLGSPAGQEARNPRTKGGRAEDEVNEKESVHSLLARQQNQTQIVKNPREYQIELFERAKKENTIAVLDTGSGKTLIAVLLLRWIIDNEIESRAAGRAPKISFFLVASVTLVYQQFSVLECNLDHKIIRLCGADNVDRWSIEDWFRIFNEHKVVVCTAEILFQCLSRGFLFMNQINLLIFDEAHHTKKNHSYARIIKDFYIPEGRVPEGRVNRPRIFGMTASPIDAKVDVLQAATELETLLDCKIATTSDMSLTDSVKRPTERVLHYDSLPKTAAGAETALLRDLRARFSHIGVFDRLFERADEIARHLGRWCADSFLFEALSPEKSRKYSVEIEKQWHARKIPQRQAELDDAVKEVQAATDYVYQQADALEYRGYHKDLSPKVQKLDAYLRQQFEGESKHRAIVFVDRRYTARLLHKLYVMMSQRYSAFQHMRTSFLIGSTGGGLEDNNFSFRQQVKTLLDFREGKLNCLFATSVAEEGLDVPDCNLVVRFDLYSTMIQYVQSRGRARNQDSLFIHMLESGNSVHSQALGDVRWQELNMRKFCDSLPEDRRLHGNEDEQLEAILDKERNIKIWRHPTTGATLNYGNALDYLNRFVSAIPTTESAEPQHPTFTITSMGQKFRADINLPGMSLSPLPEECFARKALARRAAAFNACMDLYKRNLLDAYLRPTYTKKLPAMRNALLAVNMKKQTTYALRVKPAIWAQQRGTLPTELYVTVFDFPTKLDRPHQSIAMLTRTAMPQVPTFPVYLNDGRETIVVSMTLKATISLGTKTLNKFTTFTLRVFEDVFSKLYEEDDSKLSYWLAPTTISLSASEKHNEAYRCTSPDSIIDWRLVDDVVSHSTDKTQWSPGMPNESLADRFLVDVYDGSRKWYSKAVDPTKRATDPKPEGVAKSKLSGTILDYSISLWKKAREAKASTWLRDQPVVEADQIIQRRNLLARPPVKESSQVTKAYLCPQPLRISILPPQVVAPFFLWPAIVYRLESHLITREGCEVVGVDCTLKLALAAFTKDTSENQGEHEADQPVSFQNGMGENYERLEFIGDTFLKTATTISTFILNPNENEFEFHVRRMLMLCNQNLFKQAVQNHKLYEYIRHLPFHRRLWYPEGMKLLVGTGVVKGQEKEMYHDPVKHALGEKTIADVCEALIGAALLTYDRPGSWWQPEHWDHAVRAVTKLVNSEDHQMLAWNDYKAAYVKPQYQIAEATAVQKDLVEKVMLEHDYRFTYPRLLYSAFVHPSMPFSYERVPNYQRLEFLGDALLDQASIAYLFYKYSDKDPQWLTEHKMAMVSNKFLGALCVIIGFHKHLRHHHAQMEQQVHLYVEDLKAAKELAGDSRDYWTTVSDPPKCLADIVEAYIGAMFIDSEFNYAEVQRFFETHVKWFFEDMEIYDTFANSHPVTHLHKMMDITFGCMDYRLMARELPSADGMEMSDVVAIVMIHDRVVAHSSGKSGRYARLRVANKALALLEGLIPFEYRARFGCDCRHSGKLKDAEDLGVDCAPGLCEG